MTGIYLTQYSGKILGPIAKLLGYIMQGIYWLLDKMHIGNIGLAIILFTIVVYLLMMPLTIKQQKFSKLSAKMNPELQAIQAKYKGKQDQASMLAMQEETKAVYAKYGVSPTGSCVQLIIQMPILFALYRVIQAIPAYVPQVKDKFSAAVDAILASGNKGIETLSNLASASVYKAQISSDSFTNFINNTGGSEEYTRNTIVDILNRASTNDWLTLENSLTEHSSTIESVRTNIESINSFGNLNIGNSPWDTMISAWADKAFFVLLCALLVPVLAAVTQYVNAKLAPTATDDQKKNTQDNPMAQSMQSMTTIMPIMSAIFAFTLPIGMGIYWIAGAVVRTIQQIVINKHIDKMDIDGLIAKNIEKNKSKINKTGTSENRISNAAKYAAKYSDMEANKAKQGTKTQEERDAAMKKASEYYGKGAAKPGSITAKANMVKQYDNKKNK